MSQPSPSSVEAKLIEIEAEMKAAGFWQASPLTPEQAAFSAPFGLDRMSFSQWLQFVFVPRVREAVESGRLPGSSNVSGQAVREFDTDPSASRLVRLLSEFDALFGG